MKEEKMSKIPTYPKEIFCYDCGRMQEHRPKMDAVKNGNLVCNVCDAENPFRKISETPDKWVIVKIPHEGETFYKVFATWAGGYTDGDRWKMNSGITKVEEDDNYFYFYGYSGSCYKCHKKGYGFMTSYGSGILDGMIKRAGEGGVTVEVMGEILEETSEYYLEGSKLIIEAMNQGKSNHVLKALKEIIK